MKVPNSQLTTNFLAKYQLTANPHFYMHHTFRGRIYNKYQLRWYDFILCYFSTKGFTLYQISKQREEGPLDGHTKSSLYILTAKIAFVASYRVWRKTSPTTHSHPLREFTSR